MIKEKKIKVLAELDGWERVDVMAASFSDPSKLVADGQRWKREFRIERRLPDYLESYDAIIPLIQKQPRNILTQIVLSMKGQNDVSRMVDWLMFSPEELVDILIKVIEDRNPVSLDKSN